MIPSKRLLNSSGLGRRFLYRCQGIQDFRFVGFRVSGFGFQVQGFGFKVLGHLSLFWGKGSPAPRAYFVDSLGRMTEVLDSRCFFFFCVGVGAFVLRVKGLSAQVSSYRPVGNRFCQLRHDEEAIRALRKPPSSSFSSSELVTLRDTDELGFARGPCTLLCAATRVRRLSLPHRGIYATNPKP